jgi:hypothetical protein
MPTDLTTFAAAVKAACQRVPAAGRFGSKTWIHAAWAIGRFDMGLAEFKAALAEANRLRLLDLVRCDLVEAFDAYDVERSTVRHLGATYNFVQM